MRLCLSFQCSLLIQTPIPAFSLTNDEGNKGRSVCANNNDARRIQNQRESNKQNIIRPLGSWLLSVSLFYATLELKLEIFATTVCFTVLLTLSSSVCTSRKFLCPWFFFDVWAAGDSAIRVQINSIVPQLGRVANCWKPKTTRENCRRTSLSRYVGAFLKGLPSFAFRLYLDYCYFGDCCGEKKGVVS